jgi:hypothetical protein
MKYETGSGLKIGAKPEFDHECGSISKSEIENKPKRQHVLESRAPPESKSRIEPVTTPGMPIHTKQGIKPGPKPGAQYKEKLRQSLNSNLEQNLKSNLRLNMEQNQEQNLKPSRN